MFDYDSRNGCMNVRPNFGCADNCGCGCAGVVVGQRGKTGPQGPAGRTGATGPTAPSIYAQHGNCRNHAAFHYLKDN